MASNRHFPLITLLLLLPLAGIALYRGLRVAVLAVVLLDGGLVVLISLFHMQENAFQFQIVMVAIAAVGVWLGGEVEARDRVVARYRDFFSVSNDLLWDADRNGRVLELDDGQRCRFINVNGCAMTGRTQEEAQGRAILDFVHPDDREYVAFVLKINQQSDNVHWIEFRLDRTNQRCSAHWINVDHADSTQSSTIMVLTSASARAQQDGRLWTLAHHDGLTDLPNRNLFWDRMGQALRYARRRESGAAVLWIDLDGFKAVNDRFGHAAGDLLLQQLAQRLRDRIRESDTVARMGGDEFAVIMPDITGTGGALQTANALVASLAEPFQLPHGEARISSSIGVALYPQHANGVESLTQCADMAMYQAKKSGKNQVRLWDAKRKSDDSA